MCSCQQHSKPPLETAMPDGLSFRVDDMACGHCAGTIKNAIETALPGTTVIADPASKLVSVRGSVDYAAVAPIVIGTGYTPSAGHGA